MGSPILDVVGDAYSAGSNGVGVGAKGWPAIMAAQLHWRLHLDAAGNGTGYVAGSNAAHSFGSRLSSVVAAHPTAVIVFGSRSDVLFRQAKVDAAASSFLAALRAQLPTTPIIVIGPCWPTEYPPADTTPAARTSVVAATKAAAATADMPFIDPISGKWLTAANANLTDDKVHPNNAGQAYIAKKMLLTIDQIAPGVLKPAKAATVTS